MNPDAGPVTVSESMRVRKLNLPMFTGSFLRSLTAISFPGNCRQAVRLILVIATVAMSPSFGMSPGSSSDRLADSRVSVQKLALGFNGEGRVGNWLPVTIVADGLNPDTRVRLLVTAIDPQGNACESEVAEGKAAADGTIRLEGVFMTGRLDSPIEIQLTGDSDGLLWEKTVTCRPAGAGRAATSVADTGAVADSAGLPSELILHRHRAQTLLTVGSPAGIEELMEKLAASPATRDELTWLRVSSAADLPRQRRGLDAIDQLFLVTDFAADERQTRAIHEWVLTGGHLQVSCGRRLPELMSTPIGSWIQLHFGLTTELTESQDLTALQNFVPGASQLQTNRENVAILQVVSPQARVIVDSINGPLISRVSGGAGLTTLISVDLNARPIDRWRSLPMLYEILMFDRLLDSSVEQSSRRGRISSSGVSDLSTQLASVADAVPSSDRWSSWQVMLLILVYLAVIGPLDYLLVVRLLKRPRMTWVTFPALVLLTCGMTYLWADSRTAAATVRSIHLLDIAESDSRQILRARTWCSLSTHDSRYGSVRSSPVIPEFLSRAETVEHHLTWHGRAEDNFGGFYRLSGAGVGQQTSRRRDSDGEGFDVVPLLPGGSQAFLAETFAIMPDDAVFQSDLEMPPSGLLEGSFVHHLPGPVRDWAVVFRNRVYSASPKASPEFREILPGSKWVRETGNVRVSEIRDFLRGVRIVSRETGKADRNSSTTTQIQSVYDIQGTNALDILTMISLYNTAGGEAYTRLQNNYLRRDEVSDAIQYNVAMLIGTVDLPVQQLTLDTDTLTPGHQQTIVRAFLPVSRAAGTSIPLEADPKAD